MAQSDGAAYVNTVVTTSFTPEVGDELGWLAVDSDGIGTASRLMKNADPIHGVAILLPNDDMDLIQVFVRLPPDRSDLTQNIVAAVEHAFRHGG
jgi:hypothetical protein